MALLKRTRTTQYPVVAEFTFNFNDTMVDVAGVTRDFGSFAGGSAAATQYTFEAIPLPPNAVVIGGDISTEIAFDSATYAVIVGDSGSANRYHATADLKGVARVPLLVTGFRGAGENIRIAITVADVCTTGKMTLKVQYITSGRANESLIA